MIYTYNRRQTNKKYYLSIGTIFNDLERHLTHISSYGSGIQRKMNRNSYAFYQVVPLPMTVSDP